MAIVVSQPCLLGSKGGSSVVRASPDSRGVQWQVGHRIERKRIHVRVEHVHPSRCKEEFLRRQKQNDEAKHEAHVKGGAPSLSIACGAVIDESPSAAVAGLNSHVHARPQRHVGILASAAHAV